MLSHTVRKGIRKLREENWQAKVGLGEGEEVDPNHLLREMKKLRSALYKGGVEMSPNEVFTYSSLNQEMTAFARALKRAAIRKVPVPKDVFKAYRELVPIHKWLANYYTKSGQGTVKEMTRGK